MQLLHEKKETDDIKWIQPDAFSFFSKKNIMDCERSDKSVPD
jgi:hypothetical protein